MGYFAKSTYDAIRQDPTKVMSLYKTYASDFTTVAGLQGLSEGVRVAAFCSVMAYDLAPYGSSSTGVDLTALLKAPVLSCAQYVELTLLLLEQFGRTDLSFHFAGWDGGAVGNHAQLFASSNGSNALLDPTIGLIVPGATLARV